MDNNENQNLNQDHQDLNSEQPNVEPENVTNESLTDAAETTSPGVEATNHEGMNADHSEPKEEVNFAAEQTEEIKSDIASDIPLADQVSSEEFASHEAYNGGSEQVENTSSDYQPAQQEMPDYTQGYQKPTYGDSGYQEPYYQAPTYPENQYQPPVYQEPEQNNQQYYQQNYQQNSQQDYQNNQQWNNNQGYQQAEQSYTKGPLGEVRSPMTVLLLTLVTCGIYGIIWMYKVSQEINDYTRAELTNPTFVIIGIFCGIFSWINIYKIDQALVQIDRVEGRYSEGKFLLWLLLTLIFGFGYFMMIYQVQEQLNKIWISNGANAQNPSM